MLLWNVQFLFWNVPLLSTYNIYILELVIIMTIGNRIRELRISKNMSQKELSELIDVSKSAISKYESDSLEPNIRVQIALAEAFNVTIDYLIGYSDENTLAKSDDNIAKMIELYKDLNENNRILALAKMIELLNEQSKRTV